MYVDFFRKEGGEGFIWLKEDLYYGEVDEVVVVGVKVEVSGEGIEELSGVFDICVVYGWSVFEVVWVDEMVVGFY